MTGPAVTVVIPVYNRREYIRESVESALCQSSPAKEVIVVDDGSTDGSLDRLAGLEGIRIIRKTHCGRSAARNAGIRAARGEIIAFLDSDDIWVHHMLARQFATLQANPRAGLVSGHVLVTDGSGTALPADTDLCRRILDNLTTDPRPEEAFIRSAGIFTSTVLVPRRVLDEVGVFDESLEANEDWDLCLRILRRWPLAVTSWPPIIRYRTHLSNTPSVAMARGMISAIGQHMNAPPPLSRRAQALMLIRLANAYRILRLESAARRAIRQSLFASPLTALNSSAVRLTIGSFLARLRARAGRSPEGQGEQAPFAREDPLP